MSVIIDTGGRHFPLQGSRNFRDFGGYPTRDGRRVKSGLLFRSDSLAALTTDDLSKLRPLNIQAVCDLRRPGELERAPSLWHDDSSTTFHHLPLFDDRAKVTTANILERAQDKNSAAASREIMIEIYRAMVTDPVALSKLRTIFSLLVEPENLPVLLHCSGGKDRTGVSCALILALLEVDKKDIFEDYMLSLELYSNRLQREAQNSPQVYEHSTTSQSSREALLPILRVEPAYLQSAFDSISEHYGNELAFFKNALGLDDAAIKIIRGHLLEE